MKRSILIAVAATLLVTTSAWSEVDGFRGMKWGADLSEIKKKVTLVPVKEDGLDIGDEIFNVKGDQMTIGAARIKSIQYCFWHGKFKSVMVVAEGYTNFMNMKEATLAKFPGAKESTQRRDYWFFTSAAEGEERHAVTGGSIDYNRVKDEGRLFLVSMELKDRQNEEREQRAKQAAKTDF